MLNDVLLQLSGRHGLSLTSSSTSGGGIELWVGLWSGWTHYDQITSREVELVFTPPALLWAASYS